MEQKVRVDWDKWEKQERPKFSALSYLGIFAFIAATGLALDQGLLGVLAALVVNTAILFSIKFFSSEKRSQLNEHDSSAAS